MTGRIWRILYVRLVHSLTQAYDSPDSPQAIGAIVCKQDAPWGRRNRGYIAMLSVEPGHRRRGIGESDEALLTSASTLVRICLSEMARQGGYEVSQTWSRPNV